MTGEMPRQGHHRLAFIIPTRNRAELLSKLLTSIRSQEIQPDQIVIVDGSDIPVRPAIEKFLRDQDTCIHITPPSLTRQRNAGIEKLHPSITLAGFLDDDLEFEPGAVSALMRFWETCPENTGGAELNIINIPDKKPLSGIIRRLFCMDGPIPGMVLKSGFCTPAFPAKEDHACEWLCGGATIWSRRILDTYRFDEWYKGWAYHEDAEFSYRVAKNHPLFVVHTARVTHNPPPVNLSKNYAFGKMGVINRYYFVTKNPELSIGFFYWSTIGEFFINILQSAWDRNLGGIDKARGTASAVYHILRGDLVQINENIRVG